MVNNEEICVKFRHLEEQCVWLRTCYNTYCNLYETDDDTKYLLQTSDQIFFRNLNEILIEYIIILICRITDPPNIGKHENITVKSINFDLCRSKRMTKEIFVLSGELLDYRKLIVKARNKIIAHSDKHTVLKNRSIGGHSKEDVDDFFRHLQVDCMKRKSLVLCM